MADFSYEKGQCRHDIEILKDAVDACSDLDDQLSSVNDQLASIASLIEALVPQIGSAGISSTLTGVTDGWADAVSDIRSSCNSRIQELEDSIASYETQEQTS